MSTMHRVLAAAGAYASALVLAAACTPDVRAACYESGATAYRFHVPGDSTAWFHWQSTDYPVRVYAEPGTTDANTDAAMALWLNAFRCDQLRLAGWADSTTADIVVRTTAGPPPLPTRARAVGADSANACRGRTDFVYGTQGRIERPIRSYLWPQGVDTAATTSCYHFVTAHELGHALGLLQHSPEAGDLMYTTPWRPLLTVSDAFTIQVLYGWTPTLVAEPR